MADTAFMSQYVRRNKMPMKSEAQRRAMYAAASGHGNLGIPKKVAKEYVAHDKGGKLPQKVAKKKKHKTILQS